MDLLPSLCSSQPQHEYISSSFQHFYDQVTLECFVGQYASYAHKDLLQQYGITQSMSRKGNCWDNAVAESFFHTLKTELTHHEFYETKAQANQSIFEYIEVFYNRERMHSSNKNLSPVAYEEKMMLQNEIAA